MKQANHTITILTMFILMLFQEHSGWTLPTLEELIQKNERLQLAVDKSQILKLRTPAKRVSIVSTTIADVQILDPNQVLISAKSTGETSLIVWMQDGSTLTLDVVVNWNIQQIKNVFDAVMPDEAIEIISLDNGVALQGSVSKTSAAVQAVELAESFVPHVVNLLEVPGIHQVMLKVKIAEVARSYGDEFGVDFRSTNDSVAGGSLLGGLISGNLNSNTVSVSDAATMFFGFPNSNFDVFVKAMQAKGLLYIMAEPNLVARSGETASFLAGGEFPIPVVQSGLNSSITIEYREFGVRLNFTPTVISQKTIQLDITPEVSDLDFSRGVNIGGFVIPVITTRRASTSVKLNHGQTFAIAGLINQQKQKTNKKIPGLGGIPLFGNLFKSRELAEVETELLIMVTPYLVAPLEEGQKFSLPTDVYQENFEMDSNKPLTEENEIKNQRRTKPINISSQILPDQKRTQFTYTKNKQEQNNWMDSTKFE